MTFEDALAMLKQGHRMQRASWPPVPHRYIYMVGESHITSTRPNGAGDLVFFESARLNQCVRLPHHVEMSVYAPTQADLFAKDWQRSEQFSRYPDDTDNPP